MKTNSTISEGSTLSKKERQSSLFKYIKRNRALYLLLIPGLLYYLIFKYIPLLGSIIAFKDLNIYVGILESEWVGFHWFIKIFSSEFFPNLLMNTLTISFSQLIFSFPFPILLALLLNEVRNMAFKRTIQTVIYLPHFLSWAIVAGLAYMLLSSQTGIVNSLLVRWGIIGEPIEFLLTPDYTRAIIVGAGMWKEAGWSTIIFLATLSGINISLYEAAKMDGAGRWKQCLYITIPGLLPAIVTLFLLKVGNIMDLGFESVYPFINPRTASKGEVFDTYTYVVGIVQGQYSLTTAVGIFKSVVGFMLLLVTNKISKATVGEGIF